MKPLDQPLVSIVVPVYNGEEFLKQALDSILRQTYKNTEIIILDNCSTDKTPKIIKSYKDSRIRSIRHSKNLGGYPNWDYGLSMAKGEYIAIYHADDVYEKTIVEKELAILREHDDVNCVFTNAILIDGKGKKIGDWKSPPELTGRPITSIEAYQYILRTFRSPFLSPSCFARRDAYTKAGHFTTKFTQAGDVDMYLRLAATGKAYLLPTPLVRYRHTGEQWSIKYSTTYTKPNELFDILDARLPKFRRKITHDAITMYEAHRDWDFTVCAINTLAKDKVSAKEARDARRFLRRSLTRRRIARMHKELPFMAMTMGMLLAAHAGFGKPAARAINKWRWKRHLAK